MPLLESRFKRARLHRDISSEITLTREIDPFQRGRCQKRLETLRLIRTETDPSLDFSGGVRERLSNVAKR